MAQPELIKDINDQVSAVDPNGDTMVGTLRIQKSTWPQLLLHETTVNRHAVNEIDTDGRYVISVRGETTSGGANGTYLFLDKETQSLNKIIRWGRNINGVWEEYNILHTGNKNLITADDVSASRAHKDSWDFTQQHHSNEVTFDMKNAPGAPPGDWVNGFVSTHNNYLSSYIVNAHRTNNWYVGYGETVGVSPTWYKLLHSGNYSEYTLPLTGGTMTGSITMSNNAILTLKSSSITQSAPSSTTYYEPIQWYDANNKRIGAIGTTLYSNGEIATHIQVQREINGVNKYQHLYMIIDSNGDGYCKTTKLYGAVWNDYAEYRSSDPIEPGRVICETGNGTLKLSTERLQPGANVVSDTFGFAIGETENCKTPIAVSGRALVYTYEDRYSYNAGDPVCAGPGGTVSKMSREEVMMYPDRIVGTVSEIPEYERWGTGNVEVKNRIWIRIK